MAQLVKNPPGMQETPFDSWVGKIRWRRDRLPTPVFLGLPCGSAGKEFACNAGDLGLIPGLRRSPVEGKGYYIVHGVPKTWSQLSNFHFQHNSDTLSLIHLFGMTVNSCLHAPNLQNFWTSQSKDTIVKSRFSPWLFKLLPPK